MLYCIHYPLYLLQEQIVPNNKYIMLQSAPKMYN